jgi:diguanylate cyclase (GGDEF)-like protein/PAS domain S-box-containing protein
MTPKRIFVRHGDVISARRDAEAAMAEARAAHARLREAIDILPEGVVFLDAEGRYILWNQQYADIYKRSADQFAPGARLEDTLRIGVARGDCPAAVGQEEEWIARRLALLKNPAGRHEQMLSDGRCILIEERRTSEGGIIGLRVDITEMKAREASFRLLFEANPIPMFVYDRRHMRILAANDAAVSHYGFPRDNLLAMSLRDIHDASEFAELETYTGPASDRHAGRTWKHRRADGSVIDVAVYSRELTHEGTPAVLIAAIDITERKKAEARVAFMAHHDALTGLPNRVLLRSRMEQALQRTAGRGHTAALYIDIDHFKNVNDTLGHAGGDMLLQRVAERLRTSLREQDFAGRLGGDEFAVVLTDVAHPEDASRLAARLISLISAPYDICGQQALIGASIGIALAPGDGDDVDQLMRSADMALYRAKADGKGAYRFFEREMDARLQARRVLETDLRRALITRSLDVHYQPMVDLATCEIAGFEALVRWPHPERGFIPPAEFIPVAEESGLIIAIGDYVLRRACADAVTWPSHMRLAVNLSALQFRVGDVLALVRGALAQSGLAPQRLELEITESLMLEKSKNVLATLHALREMGVSISMDDFGTGYSSLSYLRSFPFDRIKIDRSFVRELASNLDSQAIVRAILSMGSSLGITVTAEGIESEAELACLRTEGCDEGQGYLFGKPCPREEIGALLDGAHRKERAA